MLKTIEEVEKSRQAFISSMTTDMFKRRTAIHKAHDVVRKLVEAGIPVETRYDGQAILFKAGSETARKISKTLGVSFKKKPDANHMDYDGELDGVRIHLWGTIPENCRVVYEDKVIPEHTEKVARIVCNDKK